MADSDVLGVELGGCLKRAAEVLRDDGDAEVVAEYIVEALRKLWRQFGAPGFDACVAVLLGHQTGPLLVVDVSSWRDVRYELTEILRWLTDDDWAIEFHPGVAAGEQRRLFRGEAAPYPVALFSGGLDSTVGVARALASGERYDLLSFHGNNVNRSHQHGHGHLPNALKDVYQRRGDTASRRLSAWIRQHERRRDILARDDAFSVFSTDPDVGLAAQAIAARDGVPRDVAIRRLFDLYERDHVESRFIADWVRHRYREYLEAAA